VGSVGLFQPLEGFENQRIVQREQRGNGTDSKETPHSRYRIKAYKKHRVEARKSVYAAAYAQNNQI